jgi:hypothetical protein
MKMISLFLFVLITLINTLFAEEMRLLIVEDDNCDYCELWQKEVGFIYSKTEEGRIAPLLRHEIANPLPGKIKLSMPPHFTPTFILLVDHIEVSRLEGYPGDNFFWPIISEMIRAELK